MASDDTLAPTDPVALTLDTAPEAIHLTTEDDEDALCGQVVRGPRITTFAEARKQYPRLTICDHCCDVRAGTTKRSETQLYQCPAEDCEKTHAQLPNAIRCCQDESPDEASSEPEQRRWVG